jgi:hypothetical protein
VSTPPPSTVPLICFELISLVAGQDLNLRPLGYERAAPGPGATQAATVLPEAAPALQPEAAQATARKKTSKKARRAA